MVTSSRGTRVFWCIVGAALSVELLILAARTASRPTEATAPQAGAVATIPETPVPPPEVRIAKVSPDASPVIRPPAPGNVPRPPASAPPAAPRPAPAPRVAVLPAAAVPTPDPDPVDPDPTVPVPVEPEPVEPPVPEKALAPSPPAVRPVVPPPAARMDRNLSPQQKVQLGHDLFVNEWTPLAGGPGKPDGLGPLFNETSCVGCHNLGGKGGGGPATKNVVIEVHPRISKADIVHHFGVSPLRHHWTDRAHIPLVTGPYEKAVRFTFPNASNVQQSRHMVQRNTPALFGAGLIDSIPDEVLIAAAQESKPLLVWETREDEGVVHYVRGETTKGRVSDLRDGARFHRFTGRLVGPEKVGRFGWKAQTATAEEFVLNACAVELGLHVPGLPKPKAAADPAGGNKEPAEPAFDMSQAECHALVAYVRQLPRPRQRAPLEPESYKVMVRGQERFHSIGCADCHRETLGTVQGIYSDLLLHNMGLGLADLGGYGGTNDNAFANEWRTPPLWGCRDSAPYLHDGRAETLQKAIALHGGAGSSSAWKFLELSHEDQQAVLTFLKSLAAP